MKTIKTGLVGPSYVDRSLPFDAQRTINLFPVIDESQGGKEVAALQGTPGLLNTNLSITDSPIRGMFTSSNGNIFFVAGDTFYEMEGAGGDYGTTDRGTLDTSSGDVHIDENGLQIGVCDGANFYIYSYETETLDLVLDAEDDPAPTTMTFIDGYFVVSNIDSGQFNISAQYDGATWDALDFATAESSPDILVRVFSAAGQLWLFGDISTEVWTNAGGADFLFTRINGAKIDAGCAAALSVVALDNTVFWLGKDSRGSGIVYRANGFLPQRISTHAIEYALQQVDDLSVLKAYAYQQDGHLFYVLTGEGLSATLVYDVSTQLWHERAYLNSHGAFERHLGDHHAYAFGRHFVGSRSGGVVYEMSPDYFDDDGDVIKSQRIFTHLYNKGDPIRINSLEVDFETGVGVTAGDDFEVVPGSAPVAWLEVSEDGGRTYGPEYQASIGALGKYLVRAVWRRLGMAYQFTFRLSITDPVKRSICGAYIK